MPKTESPKKGNQAGIIPKNKLPGPIEAEARYRKNFPGAGAYVIMHDKPWNEQMTPQQLHSNMTKAPRQTMADELIAKSKHPEKSTPSPNDYTVNREKLLPSLGRGGGSLLAA